MEKKRRNIRKRNEGAMEGRKKGEGERKRDVGGQGCIRAPEEDKEGMIQ